MREVTVRQALQFVADNPVPRTTEVLQMPAHELICRELFDIANNPDASVRGSMTKANKARRLIFDRLVGRRAAGTAPAARTTEAIEFVDLTAGVLP